VAKMLPGNKRPRSDGSRYYHLAPAINRQAVELHEQGCPAVWTPTSQRGWS